MPLKSVSDEARRAPWCGSNPRSGSGLVLFGMLQHVGKLQRWGECHCWRHVVLSDYDLDS